MDMSYLDCIRYRKYIFICGTVDSENEVVTLWRGDLKSLAVPFRALASSGDGVEPDFKAFSVMDYGHTVRLGEYEAAADAILYVPSSGSRRGSSEAFPRRGSVDWRASRLGDRVRSFGKGCCPRRPVWPVLGARPKARMARPVNLRHVLGRKSVISLLA
jgi:hypothetical protein